jgi:AAA ATPase domain/Transcriptional regulatory protein, C terminal
MAVERADCVTVDAANQSLRRGDQPVALTPKAFAVLRHLMERAPDPVAKEELLRSVWAGTFVSDGVLKVTILEIRRALGDDASTPRFVETVPRRGYRFIGARAAREPGTGGTPPIGREGVLARLDDALADARAGRRGLVFVTGEAGIGKTTVLDAFCARIAGDPGVWVARGQCLELFGAGEAYLPILDALGRLSRAPGRARLVEVLRTHAPTWLMQMPSLVRDTDREALRVETLGATRERMLREMAEALEALATQVTIVLVLDDLHWSDAATTDLLAALAHRREPARLLVVGAYRPVELIVGAHPLRNVQQELRIRRECDEVPLDFLTEVEVAELLDRRFSHGGFRTALAHMLHRRTDGNPLFLATLLDYLVAQGALREGAAGWELSAPLEAVASGVPESLREMIEKQVDRLAPEDQQVLEAASVVGVEFATATVAAALGTDAVAIEERCETLVRREGFLRPLGVAARPAGTVARYAFRHALHQTVLYERIGAARCARLHRAVGEAEETGNQERRDEMAAELALHFERAHEPRRALDHLRAAAARDAARQANREAIGYLDRALALVTQLPPTERAHEEPIVREALGLVRRSMGDMTGAAADFEALAALARELGRPAVEAKALLYLASALTWGDRARRRAALDRAATLASEVDDELLRAHAFGYAAYWNLPIYGWRPGDAAACATAVAAARAAGARELLCLHTGRFAYFQCLQSEYRAACRTGEEARRLALEVGNGYEYLASQHYRALALLHLGDWGTMLATLRDGIRMAERNGHTVWATFFRMQLAGLHLQAFDFPTALRLAEDGVASTRAAAHREGETFCVLLLGMAHLGLGEENRALACLRRLEAGVDEGGAFVGWLSRMGFHYGLAEYWLRAGNLEHAADEAVRLHALAAPSHERTYLALAARLRTEIALADQRVDDAGAAVTEALALVAEGDVPLAAWRVHATAAHVHARRRSDAARHRRQAAAIIAMLAESLRESDELRRSFLTAPPIAELLSGQS